MKIALAVVCLLCSLTAWGQEQGKSAVDDLIRSAEQGDVVAQYKLGGMYATGEGVSQDYAEAAKWFRLAAEQGDTAAQFNLGLMYGKGTGVPQDLVQSDMWLNLAGSRYQGEELKESTKIRELLSQSMTPQQIAEAQRLARESGSRRRGMS